MNDDFTLRLPGTTGRTRPPLEDLLAACFGCLCHGLAQFAVATVMHAKTRGFDSICRKNGANRRPSTRRGPLAFAWAAFSTARPEASNFALSEMSSSASATSCAAVVAVAASQVGEFTRSAASLMRQYAHAVLCSVVSFAGPIAAKSVSALTKSPCLNAATASSAEGVEAGCEFTAGGTSDGLGSAGGVDSTGGRDGTGGTVAGGGASTFGDGEASKASFRRVCESRSAFAPGSFSS